MKTNATPKPTKKTTPSPAKAAAKAFTQTPAPPQLDLLPVEVLERAADCLKVMAHPVRLRMVDLLMQGEYRVQNLSELCEVQPNQACEHLRLMKSCGLLGAERRGREVYYKIENPQLPALLGCIRAHCGKPGNP